MEEDKFIAFVEGEANKLGKIFILDSGEGNEFFDEENQLDVEDLSGWLISGEQKEAFVEARKAGIEYKLFDKDYVFAKWKKVGEGRLIIEFKQY